MKTRSWKTRLQLCQLAVFRTKVVAPVTDAVRFVDGKGFARQVFDQLQKAGSEDSFRSHENQTVTSAGDLLLDCANSVERHAAVQCSGGVTAFPQSVDLVLH